MFSLSFIYDFIVIHCINIKDCLYKKRLKQRETCSIKTRAIQEYR